MDRRRTRHTGCTELRVHDIVTAAVHLNCRPPASVFEAIAHVTDAGRRFRCETDTSAIRAASIPTNRILREPTVCGKTTNACFARPSLADPHRPEPSRLSHRLELSADVQPSTDFEAAERIDVAPRADDVVTRRGAGSAAAE